MIYRDSGIITCASMELPLHPVIVHFPVALTIFFLFVYPALILWMGSHPDRQKTFVLVPSLALVLILLSYGALFTGEQDEELVEKVVPHEIIEEHEHAAQYFFYFSWVPFLIGLAGIKPWKGRQAARWLTVLSQVVLVFLLLDAAHKGGKLVYEHGAARAHYEKSERTTEPDNAENGDEKTEAIRGADH
ncbi:MAG: hypothetical protein CMN76_21355 [Spirochaetaceae bacterium]|nr:hypothetical protein [Spirochaetaceae bacterium]